MVLEVRRRVAANVRAHARRKDVHLTKLADFAGVSRAQLFNFLSGKHDATLGWLDKIAAALEIDVHDLTTPVDDDS